MAVRPALIRQVLDATGRNPLAPSLTTDLVLQLGGLDLGTAPEWHLVVRLARTMRFTDGAMPDQLSGNPFSFTASGGALKRREGK
jgi:hypothetical protein